MKTKILIAILFIFLAVINWLFFENLRRLPDANYPFILIAINVDLLFLIVISAITFRKLIKVYLGKSQRQLRRKIANVVILYIFIPLLALNLLSVFLLFQSTRVFFSEKIRSLAKSSETIYRELEAYKRENLRREKELLRRLSDEELNEITFVKSVIHFPCKEDIEQEGEVYLCLGDKYIVVERKEEFFKELNAFGKTAFDLRSLTKARDIITGIYVFLIVAIGLITLLATVWLSMFFARYISEPVERLTEKAQEIARGNLNVDIEVEKTGDEIEKLSKVFKDMKDNLRKLYERLEEEKETLRKLLDTLPVAVLYRKKNGEVFVNKTFQNMFGDYREGLIEEVKKGKNIRCERIDLEEGSIHIFEDITPIVLAERFRVWQEAVKRIAHEIKNPLTPIKLNLERIGKLLERDNGKERIKEVLPLIIKEVDRINNLVNQFRHLGQEKKVKPERIKLEELVKEVSRLYTGVDIKVKGEKEVYGDRNLLKEVFYNLINNSVENGASLIIVEINSEKLIYRDNGKGISPDELKHIFEPFFSKNPKGFGIGMSIVKKVIEEHGWEVKVYPSEGFLLEIDFRSRN
ncbi:PAS domain-containing sensor histidine kinase [Aquifex pyrophilus]